MAIHALHDEFAKRCAAVHIECVSSCSAASAIATTLWRETSVLLQATLLRRIGHVGCHNLKDRMAAPDLRSLVEFSEARAFESLIGSVPLGVGQPQGFRVETFGSAVALLAPAVTHSLNMNRVIGLGIDGPADEAVLDQIAQRYGQLNLSYALEIAPGAMPADLPEQLRRRRMRRTVATAMHYRAAQPAVVHVAGVAVVRAQAHQCALVADICCSVFRMPEAVHAVIEATRHCPEWRQWLVYLGPEPIAAALSFVKGGVAWLGWDATLPQHRGHGAHAALVAARINDAADSGCQFVTAETAVDTPAHMDPSRRNYEKLGFVLAYERSTYVAIHRSRISSLPSV